MGYDNILNIYFNHAYELPAKLLNHFLLEPMNRDDVKLIINTVEAMPTWMRRMPILYGLYDPYVNRITVEFSKGWFTIISIEETVFMAVPHKGDANYKAWIEMERNPKDIIENLKNHITLVNTNSIQRR